MKQDEPQRFEKSIDTVLRKSQFFFFSTVTQWHSAVKEMDAERHIYISILPYQPAGGYNQKWSDEWPDASKWIYWIQFRNNIRGDFEYISDGFYIYSPTQLQQFIDNWEEMYKEAKEAGRIEMQETMRIWDSYE